MLDGGRPFPAAIQTLISGEMWRCADLSRRDRPNGAALPGASPPIEKPRLQPGSIEPASAAVERQNTYLLGLIDARLRAIEESNAAKLSKSA
jgi:hypothetical protein